MSNRKYNAQAILLGFGKVSVEDNDLNINIQAEHEGNADESNEEAADLGEAPAAETVETVETEEAPAEVAEDTSGTPEAAELDVQDAAEEVDETVEQVENVAEVAEGLEGIALTLARISVENLEVSPLAAQMLNDQYDFVTRKFPALRQKQNRVASCEAFGLDPYEAQNVSLEKVMDNLKNAAAAIVKFLKDLWQKFLSVLGNVNASIGVMRKKAESLSTAKAGKAPEKVNVPGLLGSGLSAANVQKLTALVKAMTVTRYTDITAAIAGNTTVEQAFKQANANLVKTAGSGSTLIGNFKLELSEGGVPKVTAGDNGEGSTRPAFGENDVHSIAKAVVELASALEDYKRGESNRKKVNDYIIGEIQKGTASEDDNKLATWKKAREASQLWGRQIAFEQGVVRRAISVGNAVNNVLSASLGGKAKEEKKADGKNAVATV